MRYYNPKSGRFLSPDPVGYPHLLNLYSYGNGDPVNNMDLDGRFSSDVYKAVPQRTIDGFSTYEERGLIAKSQRYAIGSKSLARGAIGFMNGIANSPEQARNNCRQITNFSGDIQINGIYNASNTIFMDLPECIIAYNGTMSTPAHMYVEKWNELIATKGPDAKFLEICHSGAATHLRNALLSVDKAIRNKIIVVAIAPSVIIPKKLCYESYNYISSRDVVTHMDIYGKIHYGNELIILKAHKDASLWDHDFLSPTFDSVKKRHIEFYISKYGN